MVCGCIRAMLPAETAVVLVPTLQIPDSPVTGAIAGCQGAGIVSSGDHRQDGWCMVAALAPAKPGWVVGTVGFADLSQALCRVNKRLHGAGHFHLVPPCRICYNAACQSVWSDLPA